jgi:hypothetical protein
MPININGKYVPKKYAPAHKGRPQRIYSNTEPGLCSVLSLLKNAQDLTEVDWAIKFAHNAVMYQGWRPNKQTLIKWYKAITTAMIRMYPDGFHVASPEETLFIDYYFSFTTGETIFVDRLNAATTPAELVAVLDQTVNVSDFFPPELNKLYGEAVILNVVRVQLPGWQQIKRMYPKLFQEKTQPKQIIENLVELKEAVDSTLVKNSDIDVNNCYVDILNMDLMPKGEDGVHSWDERPTFVNALLPLDPTVPVEKNPFVGVDELQEKIQEGWPSDAPQSPENDAAFIECVNKAVIRDSGLPASCFGVPKEGLLFAEAVSKATANDLAKLTFKSDLPNGRVECDPESSVLKDLILNSSPLQTEQLINGVSDQHSLDCISDAVNQVADRIMECDYAYHMKCINAKQARLDVMSVSEKVIRGATNLVELDTIRAAIVGQYPQLSENVCQILTEQIRRKRHELGGDPMQDDDIWKARHEQELLTPRPMTAEEFAKRINDASAHATLSHLRETLLNSECFTNVEFEYLSEQLIAKQKQLNGDIAVIETINSLELVAELITDEASANAMDEVIRVSGIPKEFFAAPTDFEFSKKLQALAKEAAEKNAIQVQLARKLSVEPNSSVLQDLINIATVTNLTDLITGAQDLNSLDHIREAIIKRPDLTESECRLLGDLVHQRRQELGFPLGVTHLYDNIWEERMMRGDLELVAEPVTGEPDQPAMWGEGGTYPTNAIVSVYMKIDGCEPHEAKAIYDLLKPDDIKETSPSFDEICLSCHPALLKQCPWLKDVEPPMTTWTKEVIQAWLKGIEFKYGAKQVLSHDHY